jgi:hypothetical protein
MHLKHGAYYLVRKNKWIPLGRKLDEALRRYDLLTIAVPRQFYKRLLDRCSRNAACREIGFHLAEDQFWQIVDRAGGSCEVTKIPFSLTNDTTSRRAPFAPSIDRKDASQPYTTENCRLVCVCVNAALSDWGDETFKTMILAAQVI